MKYYLDPKEQPPFPKFDYQMEALTALGWDVSFLGIRWGKVYLCQGGEEKELARIPFYTVPGIERIFTFNALYRAVKYLGSNMPPFTLAYIRFMPAIPPMRNALKALKKRGTKLVMEIPTYPLENEEGTEKKWYRKLFFYLTKRYEYRVTSQLDLFTLIGKLTADSYRGIPALNITNGISLKGIAMRTYTPKDKAVHLLAVANVQVMNGFDRLIEGIAEYEKIRTTDQRVVHLHIVGPDRDGTRHTLEQLVQKLNLGEYVHFEGPAYSDKLEEFFSFADIAIGSLGLHRIGHTGIATLKAREYLAHGIPYIHAGSDPVIPDRNGWNLSFPQDDSPINIGEVISFVDACREHPAIGEEMRAFAKEHLSWESQFQELSNMLFLH